MDLPVDAGDPDVTPTAPTAHDDLPARDLPTRDLAATTPDPLMVLRAGVRFAIHGAAVAAPGGYVLDFVVNATEAADSTRDLARLRLHSTGWLRVGTSLTSGGFGESWTSDCGYREGPPPPPLRTVSLRYRVPEYVRSAAPRGSVLNVTLRLEGLLDHEVDLAQVVLTVPRHGPPRVQMLPGTQSVPGARGG